MLLRSTTLKIPPIVGQREPLASFATWSARSSTPIAYAGAVMEVGYHPIRRILCTTTATPQMPIPLATISASSREVFLRVEVKVFIKDRRTSMLHRTDRLLRPAITCDVLVDGAACHLRPADILRPT